MRAKTEPIRKTWPKITVAKANGKPAYMLDARRTGTQGRREFFPFTEEGLETAKQRAKDVAAEYAANGNEGLALSAELRFYATAGEAMLKPYGKTVLQACEFYRDYLRAEEAKQASGTIEKLAAEWIAEKLKDKLRPDSIRNIRQTAANLTKAFKGKRVLEITRKDMKSFLDGQACGNRTKENHRTRMSQFFNWLKDNEHLPRNAENPCERININIEYSDVEILTSKQVERIMKLSETEFPQFLAFNAICLFAGLRPEECKRLRWEEHMSLADKNIHITRSITKVKESRNVPINDTLLAWLSLIPEAARKGEVVRSKNFTNAIKPLRAKAGFKYLTKGKDGKPLNPTGKEWKEDVMRHSFASHWLALHQNRAELAEIMGTSLDMIKSHYKRLVSKDEAKAYFAVLPNQTVSKKAQERENVKKLIPTI